MFDCVLPTRNGRNANAFTSTGQIRFRNARYAEDENPIEPGCDCPACAPSSYAISAPWGISDPSKTRLPTEAGGAPLKPVGDSTFTRAYIRHLFLAGEMLGPILVTLHNLRHFQRFMADVRATIVTDDWEGLVNRWPVAAAGWSGPRTT